MIYILSAGLFLFITIAVLKWIKHASTQALDFCTTDYNPALTEKTPLHKKWIHGAANCKLNTDPTIEVFRFNQTTYILRQNKCLNYEAPFMYLLCGKNKALLLDTGATRSAIDFPLFSTVNSLIEKISENDRPELFVIHSHHHTDHYAGDSQFSEKEKIALLAPTGAAMRAFFAFEQWPNGETYFDLGDRKLTIIPTPGHQEDAICLYDSQTKWLLTGDTIYPGYVHVKNWNDYKESIARLDKFVRNHEVSAVLGAHIEMTTESGKYYPIGTTYQPDEAPLLLTSKRITDLHAALKQTTSPTEIRFDEFIVGPMGFVQKTVSNAIRLFIRDK